MKNRLHCVSQSQLLLGLLFLLFQVNLLAQAPEDDFIFTEPMTEPLLIYVDENCEATLFTRIDNEDGSVVFVPNWVDTDGTGAPINYQPEDNIELSDQVPPNTSIISREFNSGVTGTGDVYTREDLIPVGTTVTVVYNASHDNGGGNGDVVTATFMFTVSIVDDLAPNTPDGFSINRAVRCMDGIPDLEELTPVDNCDENLDPVTPTDNVVIEYVPCEVEGQVVRTWVFEDRSGNSSTFNQTITIFPDTEAPEFVDEPRDLEGECDDPTLLSFEEWVMSETERIQNSVTDNCTAMENIEVTNDATSIDTQCNTMNTVTFTITDACSNAAMTTATYRVNDTEEPVLVFTPPFGTEEDSNIENISCTDDIPEPPMATATDNCMLLMNVEYEEVRNPEVSMSGSGTCAANRYTLTRTWTATDACGNSATMSQVINVSDDEGPEFTLPADIVFNECEVNIDDLTLTGSPTNLVDNCDPNPTIGFTNDTISISCAYSFVVERNWLARDVCGNTTSKIQRIEVLDNTPPTFVVPEDATLDCRSADDLNLAGTPTMIEDNCDPAPTFLLPTDIVMGSGCMNGDTIRRIWRVIDACGNESEPQTQLLFIQDDEAPTLLMPARDTLIECQGMVIIDSLFQAWLDVHANATADDNCTAQDSLIWTAYNTGTTDEASLPPAECADANGVFRTQTVDFIVEDICGNESSSTATFTVEDNTPPTFTNCTQDTTIFVTNPDSCSAEFLILPVPITDECGVVTIPVMSDFRARDIHSDNPGDSETVVDTIEFDFFAAPPPFFINSNGTLTVRLNNVDAEEATEYYNIMSETGEFIGRTANTSAQCDSSEVIIDSITPLQLSNWAADGVIKIFLIPNIPEGMSGEFAINDICPDAEVEIRLEYELTDPQGIVYGFRFNEDPFTNFEFPIVRSHMPVGENRVAIYAEDCSGNRDSCVYTVTVVDTLAPIITCAGNQTVEIDTASCTAAFTIPLPTDIQDNCEAGNRYNETLPIDPDDSFITFSKTPNIPNFIADEQVFNFTGTAANAFGDVLLIATIQARIDDPDRTFTITGEDGTVLGETPTNGGCNQVLRSTIVISRDLFNSWAGDGTVTITASPQRTFASGVDYITPCDPSVVVEDGDTDGISTFRMTLDYQGINPEFMTTGATTIPLTRMMPPQVTPTFDFNVGETIITYFVDDIYENRGNCSDTITVVDNTAPVALCQGTTVFINPSGVVQDTILVSDIDAGSTDNCGIANISVSPNVFGCELIDQEMVIVTLRVEDQSGNVSTCEAPIRIVAQKPEPTFFVGDCASSDTLFLFANPPAASGGVVYTYEWTGPNGYQADVKDPIIPNVNQDFAGTYTVSITGISGCTATGIVDVTDEAIPLSPAIDAPDTVCSNEDLVLTTNTISGATYRWYAGRPEDDNGGQLLSTTAISMFTVSNPTVGVQDYYVIVVQEGCMVQPSEVKTINIIEEPEAVVNDPNITICEGEDITLGTFVTGTDIEYEWTGPDGYFSTLQFPPVIQNASTINAGTYRLVIMRGQCQSDPAFTAVNVIERPEQPQVSNNGPVCEGDEVTLTTNITDASTYTWIAPDFTTRTTSVPMLTITTVESDNGEWRVFVTKNTCDSDQSTATRVVVNPLPNLAVSSDSNPACEGDDVQLNASPTIDGATYEWTGPGFSSAAQNPLIRAVNTDDTGTYMVTITTAEGCMTSESIDIEVQAGVSINAITNDGANCLDGPTDITLTAMFFPPNDGSYIFEWRGPSGQLVSTDSIAILPNADEDDNGNYTLEISTNSGCRSATASTVVNVTNPPATPGSPQFNTSTVPPFCEGDMIILETTGYTGQIEYIWTTPLGTVVTESPSLTIDSATPASTGVYSVAVMQNGCESNSSGQTSLTITATPVANVSSNSPVCEGGVIALEIEAVQGQDVEYIWTGPGGFTSSVRNPIITPADETNNGIYIGKVIVNGCESVGTSTEVEVSPIPNLPVATSNGAICIDDEDATLILAVVPSSSTPRASYAWFDGSGTQLATSSQSLTLIITNFGGYTDGVFPFFVEATIDGCSSGMSQPVMITMSTIPDNMAFAGDDDNVCENEAIELNATPPSVGEGLWELVEGQSAGVVIANPNQANTTVAGLLGGNTYTFQWTLSNGACTDYSSDQVTLNVDVVEKADAGEMIDVCEVTSITLNATPSVSGEGEWTQPDVQAQLGVVIVDPSNPSTEVMGLVPGNQYVFTWTIFDNECAETSDDVLVLVASGVAFAGEDFDACGDGCVQLAATPSSNDDGVWTSPNENIDFTDRNDPNAVACGLATGENTLFWTINGGVCGDNSIDEILVNYTTGPTAIADEIIVEVGGIIDFDVDFNDIKVNNTFTIAILDGPNNGTLDEIEPGFYTYSADPAFVGIDQLTYELCSAGCNCSTTTVTFFVGNNAECTPPSIITPNNDGINDAFVVPCLNDPIKFPEASLSVFNQWGDEVFRRSPYKNGWMGTYNGEDLPEGTYFYILEFLDGTTEPMSGYVIIQR